MPRRKNVSTRLQNPDAHDDVHDSFKDNRRKIIPFNGEYFVKIDGPQAIQFIKSHHFKKKSFHINGINFLDLFK